MFAGMERELLEILARWRARSLGAATVSVDERQSPLPDRPLGGQIRCRISLVCRQQTSVSTKIWLRYFRILLQ